VDELDRDGDEPIDAVVGEPAHRLGDVGLEPSPV